MNFLEYIVVAIIVLGALAYLLRYIHRMWTGRQSGCGGCGAGSACPKGQTEE